MAKINGKDTYRVTLDFSKKSQEYIEGLQVLANCNTKTEVFKYALNVFDFVVNELARGNKFIVISPNDEKREVVFPVMVNKSTK